MPALFTVLGIELFVFIVFNVVSRIFYRKRHNIKYHFFQMFPYEFNYPAVFKENPYGNFLFIFSCFTVILAYIINPYTSIYRIVGLVIAIILAMLLLCLIMMPLNYLKTHLYLTCFVIALSLALPLFNFFLAFSQYKLNVSDLHNVFSILSMVYSGILAVLMILLVLNPKLTFKIYMDKSIDKDGKEVLKRPKVIFLALTEWLSIFVYFLSPIAILLLTLF